MSIFAVPSAGAFSTSPFSGLAWQPDALALLDEAHLAAWSHSERTTSRFGASLQQFIGAQRDTDCCVLHGRFIDSLETFCHQLERVLPGPRLAQRIDGPDGVVDLLRSRQVFLGRPASKFRYLVWNEADVLLRADRGLFGALVEAIAGVSAELEYLSDDLLLIQRLLLLGGAELRDYAADPTGRCRAWQPGAGEGRPFWQTATGLDTPPFSTLAIDKLGAI